jgi:hypothetical protein
MGVVVPIVSCIILASCYSKNWDRRGLTRYGSSLHPCNRVPHPSKGVRISLGILRSTPLNVRPEAVNVRFRAFERRCRGFRPDELSEWLPEPPSFRVAMLFGAWWLLTRCGAVAWPVDLWRPPWLTDVRACEMIAMFNGAERLL